MMLLRKVVKSKMIFEAKSQTKTVWQVDGLIKEGDLVILSARPKTAKSIVALNLAACVAMGIPFLGRKVAQGRALFVAYERHDLTLQRAQKMGLEGCEDFMLWDKMAWGLPRINALNFWQEFITTNSVKLFIVDTFTHFIRPELDRLRNAYHKRRVMERLQAFASETGCTVVLIHLTTKDDRKLLGISAINDAVGVVFHLKRKGNGIFYLKATGNGIDDDFFFTIRETFWIEAKERSGDSGVGCPAGGGADG